ncbi:RedY protein [Streptomyces ferrugineus]|uniref:RedY protein n=1 Tax=Streptomyces ferrugineus TaxID=1413221 RepID=A0A7M2SDY8_9ACTN|nr:RedY protein [Streptomyces ferrugineus]QOV34522.1 RedY protein [Streptomyces ferrugineus]
MTIIIHRIQLHDGVEADHFEKWVREVDYATCPELPSVLAFGVQRVARSPHYFEIIEVTSREEFERDMESSQFQRLVADFGQMAKVLEEVTGERIGDGYRA